MFSLAQGHFQFIVTSLRQRSPHLSNDQIENRETNLTERTVLFRIRKSQPKFLERKMRKRDLETWPSRRTLRVREIGVARESLTGWIFVNSWREGTFIKGRKLLSATRYNKLWRAMSCSVGYRKALITLQIIYYRNIYVTNNLL